MSWLFHPYRRNRHELDTRLATRSTRHTAGGTAGAGRAATVRVVSRARHGTAHPLPGNASGMLGVENLDPPRRPTPVRVLRCRSEGPMIVDVIDGEGYTVGRRGVKPGDEFDARERVARALQSRGRATIIADPDVAAREEETAAPTRRRDRDRAVGLEAEAGASGDAGAHPTLPADPSERCFVRVLRPHRVAPSASLPSARSTDVAGGGGVAHPARDHAQARTANRNRPRLRPRGTARGATRRRRRSDPFARTIGCSPTPPSGSPGGRCACPGPAARTRVGSGILSSLFTKGGEQNAEGHTQSARCSHHRR